VAPEDVDDRFQDYAPWQQILNGAATEMADHMAQSVPGLDVSTTLAFERTRVAYERTMLGWVRTATSLITFGFTIYKYFQIERGGGEPNNRLVGRREFALVLVSMGLVSLLLAALEHRQSIRVLRAQYPDIPRSLAGVVAALIAILGILAFIVMIFRQ
jgi:putative membrane protein